MNDTVSPARIEADPEVPVIRIIRDFAATAEQLFRAHTDPELFVRWIGPDPISSTVDHWDARTGGSWRYVSVHEGEEHGFHGCFHEVRPDRIVQTFTWEGMPDGVSLETLTFTTSVTAAPGWRPPRCATASRSGRAGCTAAWRSA